MTTIPIQHLMVIAQALKGEYRRYLDLDKSETSKGMHQEYIADLEVTIGYVENCYLATTRDLPGYPKFDEL